MFLSISSTSAPATDLGYLLHKHPQRTQQFKTNFGQAHIFYTQAQADVCTACMILDTDPGQLARRRAPLFGRSFALSPYVNDRPFAASSFLSVAISEVYGSALKGNCKERPELVEQALELQAIVAPVPCRGDSGLISRLFEPLGYEVSIEGRLLDNTFEDWGASPYYRITLSQRLPLKDLLSHLYVLLPVLDDEKHYWVGTDELQKLLDRAGDWLAAHPEKALIAKRYLKHNRGLIRSALSQLDEDWGNDDEQSEQEVDQAVKKLGLHDLRLQTVYEKLKSAQCHSVIDLGCGEGKLLKLLLKDATISKIVGLDVSSRILDIAESRLKLDRMPPLQRTRIELVQGSLTYRDQRWKGFDAACLVEVIEHLDQDRLSALEANLFGDAQPPLVIVTTPNREYNAVFEITLGRLRHSDHRFEWTRSEFESWCAGIAEQFGYDVLTEGLGDPDPTHGSPSQMAVFQR